MGDPKKLHPLTGAPIVPLGYRKDGRAIWPVMGASEDPAPADPPSDPAKTDDPPADPAKTDPATDPAKGGKDAILADLAKERDKRQQVEAQQQATLDAIAKALGLKSDDTPPDPAKLAEQITAAQSETATEKARADAAEKRLAVFLAAGNHDANPTALLDSTSFLDSIKDVGPTDVTKLGDAIKAAVEKDDRFKLSPPTPPFPGGPRKTSTQTDPGPGLPRLRDAYAQSSK